MSAIKRPADDSPPPSTLTTTTTNAILTTPDGLSPTPTKKKLVLEPFWIGPVSTLEEMDIKVLQFQQKKMRQRLEARQKLEDGMKFRIGELETRQMQDDTVLNVTNRHWDQLNEDIRILLQRFDAETSDELESKNESDPTTSFLTQLSTWDKKEELDTKLVNRVQVSTRAVAKIIQAFDRVQQRSQKITKAISGDNVPNLEKAVKDSYVQLEGENRALQALNTHLHEWFHTMSLKIKELSDKLSSEVTKKDELKNRVDELSYELSKLVDRNDKHVAHIQELVDKYRSLQLNCGTEEEKECYFREDMSDMEVVNLQWDNEELRELANNRMTELESLDHNHKEILKELVTLKNYIKQLPESVIIETTEYKCLQSKFSVMYYESNQLRASFCEARQSALQLKAEQLKQNEHIQGEELMAEKKLRTEFIQLEDKLSQAREEYKMLRIKFEQNLKVIEQTGSINREMLHLIIALQNDIQQSKERSQMYRKKYKEIGMEIVKLKFDKDHKETKLKLNALLEKDDLRRQSSGSEVSRDDEDSPSSSSLMIKQEPLFPSDIKLNHEGDPSNDGIESLRQDKLNNGVTIKNEIKIEKKSPKNECDSMKDLTSQLKKVLNEQRESKLLLDMYKGSSKYVQERVQLMVNEKKHRIEIEDLKQVIRKYKTESKEEKKKQADEDAVKRIRVLEEQAYSLRKQVAAQKLEEGLINEMEVTGQAFEDMQEKNSTLILQLREKDDANFKLLSDRIKSNQLQELAREERDLLQDQITIMSQQLDAQNLVILKLEEKERLIVNIISAMEKESSHRLQVSEGYKRKAIESAQSAADLKLHLEKYHSQMKDALQTVIEKTCAIEAEAYKTKRLQEEIVSLKRKVERLSKVEMVDSSDEVMLEEMREYKEILTCPSCKVKCKDAVLTTCFHVFCFDCLRTRYETKQRKCPKCNAAFGANDYHRLYLT